MIKNVDIKGIWWLPENPECKIAGMLYHEPLGKTKLDLIGEFRPNDWLHSFNQTKGEEVIWGLSSENKDITLLQNFPFATKNTSCPFPVMHYDCQFLIIGKHIKSLKEEGKYSARILFDELSFWYRPNIVQCKYNEKEKEIARLKKELATVREVLRSYIRQVDSLNQVNQQLVAENDRVKDELKQQNLVNQDLRQEKENLTEKVTIAAQLDATGITMTALNKRQKAAKKMKDCKTIQVGFNIARNVTAANGNRTIFVRIQTPAGQTLTAGTFPYENRQLEYSMKKVVEYTGEEINVQTYWQVGEFLDAGQYRVSIFADGNMIGTKTFTFE